MAMNFGQQEYLGSALLQTNSRTLTAPEGKVIVAIQVLVADTLLDSLIAEDPTLYINTAQASHIGQYTRRVNQSNSTTNKIIFDDLNTAAATRVGHIVYDSTGIRHGKVTALDPDGDSLYEIQIDTSVAITNNEVLHFSRPGMAPGAGGEAFTNGDKLPVGFIYGRWTSVSLETTDADGGIICYFGN
tara:strand:+ start:326 stop:886 length:561 start_codon:yes stop_codon:yes gene_type:complete